MSYIHERELRDYSLLKDIPNYLVDYIFIEAKEKVSFDILKNIILLNQPISLIPV